MMKILKKQIEEKYQTLDLIIDDGSHINELTFSSFNLFWPLLKDGGHYIIEDTNCCYINLNKIGKGWPGMSLNSINIEYDNLKNNSFDRFCLLLIRMVSHGPSAETTDISCNNLFNLSFFPNTLVITKK